MSSAGSRSSTTSRRMNCSMPSNSAPSPDNFRNRRTFIAAALTAAVPAAAQADDAKPALIDGLAVLDYGRSFVCGTASFNNVRFWVESRTVLIDGEKRYEFLQFGSCKSENTFGEKDLF